MKNKQKKQTRYSISYKENTKKTKFYSLKKKPFIPVLSLFLKLYLIPLNHQLLVYSIFYSVQKVWKGTSSFILFYFILKNIIFLFFFCVVFTENERIDEYVAFYCLYSFTLFIPCHLCLLQVSSESLLTGWITL